MGTQRKSKKNWRREREEIYRLVCIDITGPMNIYCRAVIVALLILTLLHMAVNITALCNQIH